MDYKHNQQLRVAVLLIWFRSMTSSVFSLKFATYNTYSKSLNLTQNEVQHICRKAFKTVRAPTAKQQERKLEHKHIDYLLSSQNIEQLAGLTMSWRKVRYHRWYQDKRKAINSLRRLYFWNGWENVSWLKSVVPPVSINFYLIPLVFVPLIYLSDQNCGAHNAHGTQQVNDWEKVSRLKNVQRVAYWLQTSKI